MALAARNNDTIVYVPEGNKALIESMGFLHVVENTWWDTNDALVKEDKTLVLSCLPALHWSIRFSLGSYRASLWSSWMIHTENVNIYFAGDSAYGPHFKEIGEKYPSIDLVLMPIGPTSEHENKHKDQHVDAPEAVDAFIDLGAHCFMPMHYGTFFLSKDTLTYPLEKLDASWHEKGALLQDKQLLMARCGQAITL
jgi:L-ascorbate metabolism protein UlaG (beta-lactamase superfamily)